MEYKELLTWIEKLKLPSTLAVFDVLCIVAMAKKGCHIEVDGKDWIAISPHSPWFKKEENHGT